MVQRVKRQQQERPIPESFRTALASLARPQVRPEVNLEEVPSPARLAPWTLALAAHITESESELAEGRFVVLHDPAGQDAWQGTFRVVTMAGADLETDIGHDPLLPQVAWSWVEEHISPIPDVHALGGTVTAVASESFGELADRSATVRLEVRASWTTTADLSGDLTAWSQLLCTIAGLPPLPENVSRITRG